MWRSKLVQGLGLFIAAISLNVYADTQVVERVIVTPPPKATCTPVAGHWEDNIWVTAHDVCKYENRSEGAAWISEYWSCKEATASGDCTAWELVPGHWVKTLE